MITRVHRQRANRKRYFVVTFRRPVEAAVGRLPNAPLRRADVDDVRVGRIHDDSCDAAGDQHTRVGMSLSVGNDCRPQLHPVTAASNRSHHRDAARRGGGKRSPQCHDGTASVVPCDASRMFLCGQTEFSMFRRGTFLCLPFANLQALSATSRSQRCQQPSAGRKCFYAFDAPTTL